MASWRAWHEPDANCGVTLQGGNNSGVVAGPFGAPGGLTPLGFPGLVQWPPTTGVAIRREEIFLRPPVGGTRGSRPISARRLSVSVCRTGVPACTRATPTPALRGVRSPPSAALVSRDPPPAISARNLNAIFRFLQSAACPRPTRLAVALHWRRAIPLVRFLAIF